METEKNITEKEGLDIINKMIASAKNELDDDSYHYLLWGWLVFIASAGHYILLEMSYDKPWLGWAILMPLGGLLSMLYGMKQGKARKVTSYVDEVMKYVLIAFLVSLVIVLFFMGKLESYTYPLIMVIYGVWLFVSGGALRFKPLVASGIINWVIGIITFFVNFKWQLVLLAIAVLLGYIIPGYMLKARFKKQQQHSIA